jgi:hypothetical protein
MIIITPLLILHPKPWQVASYRTDVVFSRAWLCDWQMLGAKVSSIHCNGICSGGQSSGTGSNFGLYIFDYVGNDVNFGCDPCKCFPQ